MKLTALILALALAACSAATAPPSVRGPLMPHGTGQVQYELGYTYMCQHPQPGDPRCQHQPSN